MLIMTPSSCSIFLENANIIPNTHIEETTIFRENNKKETRRDNCELHHLSGEKVGRAATALPDANTAMGLYYYTKIQ